MYTGIYTCIFRMHSIRVLGTCAIIEISAVSSHYNPKVYRHAIAEMLYELMQLVKFHDNKRI